jgi:hypothetical protein
MSVYIRVYFFKTDAKVRVHSSPDVKILDETALTITEFLSLWPVEPQIFSNSLPNLVRRYTDFTTALHLLVIIT